MFNVTIKRKIVLKYQELGDGLNNPDPSLIFVTTEKYSLQILSF